VEVVTDVPAALDPTQSIEQKLSANDNNIAQAIAA